MSLSVLLFIKDAIAIILTCDALKMLYAVEENCVSLFSISRHFEHFICARCLFSPKPSDQYVQGLLRIRYAVQKRLSSQDFISGQD